MRIKDACKGLRVMWHDPDDGLCSGPGVITSFCDEEGDECIMVKMDDGGEVEALPDELEIIPEDAKEFNVIVNLRGKVEVTVMASSFDEAFEKAMTEGFDPADVNFFDAEPDSAEREDGVQKYYYE